MTISVKSLVNADVAFSSELGLCIRDAYGASWQNETLVLDFSGMRNVSPSFLSQALMPILESVPAEKISERVKFEHTPAGFEYAWENILKAMAAKKPHESH